LRSVRGIFSSALAVGFSGAMIPGPMLAMVLSVSLNGRFWPSMGIVLGHVLLEGLLVLGVTLGIGRALRHPLVAGVVGLVGGVVLVYMGSGVVATVWREPAALAAEVAQVAIPVAPVFAGALVSASNPAWLMWWGAVGIGYVSLALQHGPAGLGAFYVGHTLSDWLWYGCVAALAVSGRQMLRGTGYLAIIMVCGLLLCAFGAYFVFLGARALRQQIQARRSL
jgi:threonine/homoserine/homoserine lactone efflux protein